VPLEELRSRFLEGDGDAEEVVGRVGAVGDARRERGAVQHHVAHPLHVLRLARRPDEIEERVALAMAVAHLARALAQRRDDHGDGAALRVHVGHRERDALGLVVQPDHDGARRRPEPPQSERR
jgi:hypothetical protein